ncbi:hypothetical protein SDC9_145695 [bioreactor metagenome]|uniref:Uncharacterized protein n=1 Tax=bioreactor metagenome TaxID=1076179 RepID=A0A645E9A9_9ZZZZ
MALLRNQDRSKPEQSGNGGSLPYSEIYRTAPERLRQSFLEPHQHGAQTALGDSGKNRQIRIHSNCAGTVAHAGKGGTVAERKQ